MLYWIIWLPDLPLAFLCWMDYNPSNTIRHPVNKRRRYQLPVRANSRQLRIMRQEQLARKFLSYFGRQIAEILCVFQDLTTKIGRKFAVKCRRRIVWCCLNSTHNLKPVVFHSLRHSSTTIKLRLSGGDIKSVQGDNGHSVADMVTNVYSEIQDKDRRALCGRMEKEFFASMGQIPAAAPAPDGNSDDPMTKIYALLRGQPEKAEKFLQIAQLL